MDIVPSRSKPAFLSTLRAAMRYAGGVRIDHIMGLQRLWLVPEGASAASSRRKIDAARAWKMARATSTTERSRSRFGGLA